ncbi:tRNA synthetases class I-domain-containing protein [Tricharina praecox]|uniref:tRNA synthetases class I-domain-containing protein n=1 Tax=Tricharina praecox TaxID=43433 RepID=UPI00221E5B1D|nr:tRNA synthetases class I-domain-containing protein [Tricharina praecox]KAI5853590.1 tRNA synthetases class I-domain-containing protein [Tricharina praecox]
MRRFTTSTGRLSTAAHAVPPTSLKSSLLLPRTSFPIRPSTDVSQHASLLTRSTSEVYALQKARRGGVKEKEEKEEKEDFVLHDGPPYANGELHMGHAMNKILKDVVNRVAVLEGKRVTYIPGWDCHGLPIELKALQAGAGGGSVTDAVERGKRMTPLEIRRQARELAAATVESQRKGFERWGVMAEWEKAYKTMDCAYEICQLEVFREMVGRGLVYRRFKPVFWSPSSGTALAEAELEYNEKHASKAAFVKMPLLGEVGGEGEVSVAVWTTTPWTLPANKAVAVGEEMLYAVVATTSYGKLLVAEERVEYLRGALEGEKLEVTKSGIMGADLVGLTYTHPLLPSDTPAHPIIAADFVLADSGTGLVHLAPGHGMDDYLVCQKHNIPPFSPVDNNGRYTTDTLPHLVGKEVLYGGTKAVLDMLASSGSLLHLQNKFVHKYPYDWRTKLPIIVRATAQWFADAENIKAPAVAALEDVKFIPESGRPRLTAFVKGRNEWCISRQRAWGVPIPALYDAETGVPLLTEQNVDHIISVLKEKGTDAWFTPEVPDEIFLAPEYKADGKTYTRGMETMDVWFDSGTSWSTLNERLGRETVADLYLEGSDQHRGWFQSSLLTSIAARGKPPFKQILTHGFVLDSKGKKMSKSLGNVVSPSDVTTTPKSSVPNINILRLWVAYSDFTKDVSIGPTVLSHVHEVLRKARVTSRFLLGVLTDWDGTYTPYSALPLLDRVALAQLHRLHTTVLASTRTYNFQKSVTSLAAYTSTALSAFYLDVTKDRLYSDSASSPQRRAAQSTAALILRNYVSLLAPFVPLLTQEVWSHAPPALLAVVPEDEQRMLKFFTPQQEWEQPELLVEFEKMQGVHDAVKRAFERAKAQGRVKVNLEVEVDVVVPEGSELRETVQRWRADLEALCIVSGVEITDGERKVGMEAWEETEEFDGGVVKVRKARHEKCVRCWIYKAPAVGGVCGRCQEVLAGVE